MAADPMAAASMRLITAGAAVSSCIPSKCLMLIRRRWYRVGPKSASDDEVASAKYAWNKRAGADG